MDWERAEIEVVVVSRDGPESYRDFILNLPNSVTPEEAHRRYQDYLTEWHGSLAKAEFEQCKDEEWWVMPVALK